MTIRYYWNYYETESISCACFETGFRCSEMLSEQTSVAKLRPLGRDPEELLRRKLQEEKGEFAKKTPASFELLSCLLPPTMLRN